MSDAMVERRPPGRFFCHKCNVEFEDVLQDYTCPYCATGFIEQLEDDALGVSSDDFNDADMSNIVDLSNMDDMSNLDDSDDVQQDAEPMLNDLAFLMSGGRLRGAGRRETLIEQLVWMLGPRSDTGAVTAGAPLVLVGAPGDYVFGGEGLDAVVTQLLGQLENSGPPPLPRDQIAALPSVPVTEEQVAAHASCSICWENFQLGENVSRLECEHVFHSPCIAPWLQLHATCPICRRSLLPEPSFTASQVSLPASSVADTDVPSTDSNSSIGGRRVVRRRATLVREAPSSWGVEGAAAGSGSSSSSTSVGSSLSAQGVWAPMSTASSTSASSTLASRSSASGDSDDRSTQYNMDIDFD